MERIRDCRCGEGPGEHYYMRVGTLVALGECLVCPCTQFEEEPK